MENRNIIENAWTKRERLTGPETVSAIANTIAQLDAGTLKIVEEVSPGIYQPHQWLMKAVILYFATRRTERVEVGPLEYYSKVPLATFDPSNPPRVEYAIVRHGSHVDPSAVLMPSFINVGAHVGKRSMIDTWATVGSGAYVGNDVHISGGVGLGGILEPLQSSPVTIGNNCFIGSRCMITEGVLVNDGAVLAQGVSLNQSTRIFEQLSADEPPKELPKGIIPPGAVVIPGSIPFRGGPLQVSCAIVAKYRDENTDGRVTLNEVLR